MRKRKIRSKSKKTPSKKTGAQSELAKAFGGVTEIKYKDGHNAWFDILKVAADSSFSNDYYQDILLC